MKNTIKWWGIIALAAVIGFSFASCEQDVDNNNGDTKTLSAGTYTTTTAAATTVRGDVTGAAAALDALASPSFTIDADGIATALSLGTGGTAFLLWAADSGTQYKFTMSGSILNFQVKQFDSNDFVNWNPHAAAINGVNYNQTIHGTLTSEGVFQLRLTYERTDHNGTAERIYDLKKQ